MGLCPIFLFFFCFFVKYSRGDMVYFVNHDDDIEIEGYIIEYDQSSDKYKVLIKDESRFEKYAFKDECQLTQIFPDYWLSLDEYIEEFKF